MLKTAWAALGLFLVSAVNLAHADLESLLPASDEIAGWTTYQWPRDEDDLYWLIDGAGIVYVDHGFQEAVFQNYYDAALVELDLEIFDQRTAANAESTYHDPSLEVGWEIPQDAFGIEGRVDTMALGSYRAEFWRDRYFVRGTILEKSSYAWQTLRSFCQRVDQRLTGKPAVDGLPDNGEIPGWTRYLLASDSLSLVSLLGDDAGLFWEWGCTAGLRQDYYNQQFVLLQLELFDQGTSTNAQSLYHDPRLETGEEVSREDFGQEGRLDTTSSWTYSAQFYRGQYLARLIVQEKSEASLADLVAFCQLVDQKIQATAVEGGGLSPSRETSSWALAPAFPNPFNDHVLIRYQVREDEGRQGSYRLGIYNVSGQLVRRLTPGPEAAFGLHALRWDGRDDWGNSVASGVYFCRLSCGPSVKTVKVVLCR